MGMFFNLLDYTQFLLSTIHFRDLHLDHHCLKMRKIHHGLNMMETQEDTDIATDKELRDDIREKENTRI